MKRPSPRRTFLGGLAAVVCGVLPRQAMTQTSEFPRRPVRIIVPYGAGGGSDAIARAIAPYLAQKLGQPVIVDNRPGAIGTIGSSAVAHSAADGYTLLLGSADSQSIAPHVMRKAPYDANRDFTSIASLGVTPLALMVHASHPARTFGQFVQLAREAKTPLAYGSWGIGSSGQITVEALKQATRIELTHVPYNSTAPLMQAQLAREIECAVIPVLVAEQHVRTGTVRFLAINAPDRLADYPEVPVIRELGVARLGDVSPWLGFLGPAGMPAEIVDKLNAAFGSAMAEPQVVEAMRRMSIVLQPMPAAKFQQFTQAEYERWGRYIRSARIQLD